MKIKVDTTTAFDDLVTPEEAGEYLGLSPGTLSNMRGKNKGPAYYKQGGRVAYKRADLDAYIESCRVVPNGQG